LQFGFAQYLNSATRSPHFTQNTEFGLIGALHLGHVVIMPSTSSFFMHHP
jgi:hypothetical protein